LRSMTHPRNAHPASTRPTSIPLIAS
jgi:hypothetical protein